MCGDGIEEGTSKGTTNKYGWSYQQELDYEHVLFKCNTLHEYEHFAKKIPNNQ